MGTGGRCCFKLKSCHWNMLLGCFQERNLLSINRETQHETHFGLGDGILLEIDSQAAFYKMCHNDLKGDWISALTL